MNASVLDLTEADTLLVATHNPGKLREIAEALRAFSPNIVSAAEYDVPEPEETGLTFAANAALKAEHALPYAKGAAVLADDSGLAVDGLDSAPGIYSARWAGPDKDFLKAAQRIYHELEAKGLEPTHQPAAFICTLALAKEGCKTECFTGTIKGHLTFPARGTLGFGYDPIFIAEGYSQTFAEIDPAEKHRISHRARAFEALASALQLRHQERAS